MTDAPRESGLGTRDSGFRTRLGLAIATSLGVGYAPIASGTWGSAAGLLLWAVLPSGTTTQAVWIVGLFIAGSWAAGVTERYYGRTDPGEVVVDEVMGMLLTLFLTGVGWPGAIAGFFLFRLFDIIKPFPARRLEHLAGGIGVMADDAMAAIYANLALRALLAIANRVIG